MTRLLKLILAGSFLCLIPACGAGGIDSRNKDLDRPKSADEKAAAPLVKSKAGDDKAAAPGKDKAGDEKAAVPAPGKK